MAEAADQRDPLEELAADFIERQRRGESPDISEYAARHPELATEIEDLFPTIAAIERLKAVREESSGGRRSLGVLPVERLGDFRLLREIGRGGMGIVFEAFQESLGRHVAVKVLPRQSLMGPRQLQRFQREAQTAARLHHTNIVPVFGVGEQDGHHYIVMQLIRGVGLDAVLVGLRQAGPPPAAPGEQPGKQEEAPLPPDAARLARMVIDGKFEPAEPSGASPPVRSEAGPGVPQPGAATEDLERGVRTAVREDADPAALPSAVPPRPAPSSFGPANWRSVAAMGLQVAEGLQYAHAHQTLHRDIKPANLLLDPQGVVWITDFGLAKAMEQDDVTQSGAIVGTLRYMAPEQFSGRTDARSDVYSLGLTLYELLTLKPAFEESDRSSLIRDIVHGEPVRPRRLNPRIPRDLETIVLKAIARDPADRYQSAGELARDLESFLEDRPIRARRAAAVERLWRWSRRNRAIAALAASTLVLLVLVTAVSVVGYVQIRHANVEEQTQREKAEATSALALEALDNIFQQFAPDRAAPASSLSLISDAGEEISVPVQPVLSTQAAAMLEHMLVFYDRLAEQGGDDARLRRKIAEANRRVGDIRQRLGQPNEAKAAYTRAIDLYRQLAAASKDDAELATEVARVLNELGNVYLASEQADRARESYTEARTTLEALPPTPAEPRRQFELARTYYFLAKAPPAFRRPSPGVPSGPPPKFAPGLPPGPPARPPGGLMPGPPPGSIAGRPMGPPPDRGDPGRGKPGPPPPRDPGKGPPGPGPGPGPFRKGPGLPMLGFGPPPEWRQRDDDLRKAVDLLEGLVAAPPAVPDYRHLLARCYREMRPPFGAEPEPGRGNLSKAIAILQKLADDFPEVPDYRYDLSETHAMANAPRPPRWGDDVAKADREAPERLRRESLQKALDISKALVAEHPNVPEYAAGQVRIRLHLAYHLQRSDNAAAEAMLREALDLQASLARRYPRTSSHKFWLAVVRESRGRLFQQRGQLPEARDELQACLAVLKEMSPKGPTPWPLQQVLAMNYRNLAGVLRAMGDEPAAAECERQAQEFRPVW